MYSAIAGSSSCYEFQSRFGGEPAIYHRSLPCRCEPCRAQQKGGLLEDNHCVLTVEAGNWKATTVAFKGALTGEATKAKKEKAKAQRAAATARKIARVAAEAAEFQGQLEGAPNPQAAVAAADLTDTAPLTGAAGLSAAHPRADLAFAAAYGAEDARQAAVFLGETEFLYRRIEAQGFSEGEDEEDDE